MRVQIVDPPAYTPPYDRALCAALTRAGAEVELLTSPFRHGPVPPADGYRVSESFYRRAGARRADAPGRRAAKAVEHVADMARHRRPSTRADIVHYQWLPLPALDRWLLPGGVPLVLTAHGLLRDEAWRWHSRRAIRRLLDRMDAVVTLSEHGAGVLRERAGIATERVSVIPHGALDYLTRIPDPAPLPADLDAVTGPVILCFGLIRPYKGTDVLLEAFARVQGAELWIVGRPLGVSMESLRRLADSAQGTVRFVPRFVPDREVPAYFRRADLVVLPHRDAEQSGVLYAALAFAKAIVMSAVGGFPEVAAHGAGRLVPPGDPEALAAGLQELIEDVDARRKLESAAAGAAAGPYAWETVAGQTLALYRRLIEAGAR
jgi:glycosyltransferase involved in cell wall biosynthesis